VLTYSPDFAHQPNAIIDEHQRREAIALVDRCSRILDLIEPRIPVWMSHARKRPDFNVSYGKLLTVVSVCGRYGKAELTSRLL
jgi:hypothetical protein